MKPLNRPMFRMGGPIKEGIMDGIEEPRVGFQDGTPPNETYFVNEFFKKLFTSPKAQAAEAERDRLAKIFAPDYSMSDYGKIPKLKNQDDLLTASITDVPIPEKKFEMVDENTISINDLDSPTSDAMGIIDITKTETVPSKSKTMLQKEKEFASGKILSDPDKTPRTSKEDSELLQKLGYDRAVKKGNYALIEAIRRGLTEGGVQGALDSAFAAGGGDPYAEANKIRQAAALKEYERKTGLEDFEKKQKIKAKFDTKQYSDSVRTKDYNFAINTLGMSKEDAIDYANKTSGVAVNIFKVTSKSQGGFASPNQLADAIRASGEKVDKVFDKSDDATKAAYVAKDGQYVVFDQEIFIGYKDPNSDEVLLNRIR